MKSFKQYFFEAINGPKVIMIGGPGSGKSTYSELITKELNIAHIYTGDMREHYQNKIRQMVEK